MKHNKDNQVPIFSRRPLTVTESSLLEAKTLESAALFLSLRCDKQQIDFRNWPVSFIAPLLIVAIKAANTE